MIPNNNQYSISNDISGVTSVVSELDKVCAYLEEMGQPLATFVNVARHKPYRPTLSTLAH